MYIYIKVKVLVAPLCLTLCNPMDCSPPGSSLHRIPGKNTGVGCISFSRGSSWPRDGTRVPALQVNSLLSVSKHGGKKKYIYIYIYISVSSVAQSCPTLCNPMDCSTPGFPVHHQLPQLAQTHVHRVGDAIQSSHPLLSPSLLPYTHTHTHTRTRTHTHTHTYRHIYMHLPLDLLSRGSQCWKVCSEKAAWDFELPTERISDTSHSAYHSGVFLCIENSKKQRVLFLDRNRQKWGRWKRHLS